MKRTLQYPILLLASRAGARVSGWNSTMLSHKSPAKPLLLSGAIIAVLVMMAALLLGPDTASSQSQPAVTRVAVSSTPRADQTYAQGETIQVTLTFGEAVNVTGTPRLKIDMDPADWGEKWANYESGSGTASLTFAHTVVEPNISTQGIAVLADTLELNGGAIQSSSGENADLSHEGLGHNANHKVDWQANRAATGAPTITGTARVGETLTAGASGISDADGLANATFSYQWLADDADISGATGTSYTLAGADEGKAVKVRVSFTDDEGNSETLTSAGTAAVAPPPLTPVLPVPHQRQIDWQKQELVAFIHFGINTFHNLEVSNGTKPPSSFDPTALDTDQWVKAVEAAGMNMVIITAKHGDGFTLWPSSTTPDYSVAASPWEDGEGDLIRDLADSARSHGLDFGVYISPGDRYQEEVLGKTSDEYNDILNTQITELLSNYGEIKEVWLDGGTRSESTLDWKRVYGTIRQLQPNAVIAVQGPDVAWIGNERGRGKDPLWSPRVERYERYTDFNPTGASVDTAFLGSSGVKSVYWRPQEVDVSIRPGWFWRAGQNNKLKSLKRMQQMYYGSVGGNSLFLLNVPPDRRGLLHENDVARLKEFGDLLKRTFAIDLTDGGTATASNERGAGYEVSNLIDGDDDTYWTTSDSITSPSFTVTFDETKSVGLVQLQEYIQLGQRVQTFTVEAMVDGSWTQVASGNTIGYKRILELAAPVMTDRIRVTFTSSRDIPVIHSFSAYSEAVVETPNDTRSDNVAYRSHATQSSTRPSSGRAKNAVDGDTSGWFSGGSVTLTRDRDNSPWWQTDLGASFNISEIKLWNRTDCCRNRLRHFHVFISDSPFTSDDAAVTSATAGVWHHHHTGTVGSSGVIPVPNVNGRYVRIQLAGNQVLSLAEVEVIGLANNLVGSGTGTASGSLADHEPEKAFDGSYATSWRVGSGTAWISYAFGSTERPNVNGYAITSGATGSNSPTGWTFEGSNDGGTEWTSLDTQTDQTFTLGQRRTYLIDSDQTFNLHRFSMANSGSEIDVAEIELYSGPIPPMPTGSPEATNVATGGTATQSSYHPRTDASKAIDGDTGGEFPNVAHTADAAVANEWWQVDVGSAHLLDRIVVWNRTDCCRDWLNPYYVLVSETPFGMRTLAELLADDSVTHFEFTSAPQPSETVTPTDSLTGRYVRVQRGGSTEVALALAEVQVYGTPARANRAPVVDEDADQYAGFVTAGWAPRGIWVSKLFEGIFSDPDGDELTYTVSLADDRRELVHEIRLKEDLQRVFIRFDSDKDWNAINSTLPNPLSTTITLTATDPDGLSASLSGDFETIWDSPATGAPTISGTARVGETLTADTSGISDGNGLSNTSFSYQWLAGDADISGATGSTYTLASTEEGKAVKVRVSFTDDAGYAESLTSAATAAVAPPPLTASFVNVPAGHDGESMFTFELRFSENFPGRLDYMKLRDEAFQVENGSVKKAERVVKGENRRWTISVRPDSSGNVVVTLPAASDCDAAGAVCTEAGRVLSNTTSATVPGPVENSPATGAPTITGTAPVGETLTAGTSNV